MFCLEDNVALILRRSLLDAGIACLGRVGIISGMGTDIVTDRKITTLQIDYERIGREAAGILANETRRSTTLPPTLVLGQTT